MASPDIFDHPSFAPKSQPQDLSKLDLTTVPNPLPHSKFVVCRPDYISTKIANNKFMRGKNKESVDVPRALNQWDREMHIIEAFGAELFEIPPTPGCQDQCWTANVGLNIKDTIVLAKYKAPGRACEIPPAKKFFEEKLGFKCIQPPYYFEGRADCLKWKDGIFIGGWGLFSSKEAYQWIADNCGVKIIPVHEINEATYHLDCCVNVVNEENFLVTPNSLDRASIKMLEKLGNVIMCPKGTETTGLTNSIKIPEKHIMLSGCFNQEIPEYRKASEWLLEEMDKLNYTVVFIDCDSYNPSGADASCSVMDLEVEPPAKRASMRHSK